MPKKNKASKKACRKTLNLRKLTRERMSFKKELIRVITQGERGSKREKMNNQEKNKKKLVKERKCKLQKINKRKCVIDLVGAN